MAEVLTFGCRLNTVESQAIALHAAALSDTIVVNTCAVTMQAERDARHAIARLHRERPDAAIVVTGCAAQIDPARWAALPGVSRVLGNQEKLRPESMAADAPGPRSADIRTGAASRIWRPRCGGIAKAAPVPSSTCSRAATTHCTFCIIPQGRGPNRSVPARGGGAAGACDLAEAGVNEVVLTGVDLASWTRGRRAGLGTLVRASAARPCRACRGCG